LHSWDANQYQKEILDIIKPKRLSHPALPAIERQALQQELSNTSTLLDYSEQFVPRPRPAVSPLQPTHLRKDQAFEKKGNKYD
jgi:hypothetical protein